MSLYSEDFIADSGEALTDKLDANAPIVGATKTKVTYDANGLVTAGADATTADIAASTDKNYVTDAQAVVIANTSGVNSGDQDLSGYVAATLDTDGTMAANSDTRVPSQKAVVTYVAAQAGGAPTDATYITQTANGSLSNEQALSALSTGMVKVTTGTGVLSTGTDGTDYLSPSTGESWTIVTLGSDFTVTNNTLQDVTGFSFSAVAGHFYQVRVTCVNSANNTTGDIAVSLATTGTWVTGQSAYIFYTYYGSTGTRNGPAGAAFASTTLSSTSPGTTINNGDAAIRFFGADFMFYADANGTVTFQMGQAAAAAGRTSTIYAGAKFQYRTLY